MSEHHVEVVRLGAIVKHPNADSLDITHVHGGYPCIIKRGSFKEGDLAVYVPVDAMVPTAREEFKFLDDGKGKAHQRIRAKKLRGTFSMGLLVPAPPGATEGQDVAALLGVDKYVPPSEREDFEPRATHAHTRRSRASETAVYDFRARFAAGIVAGFAVGWFLTGHLSLAATLAVVISASGAAFFAIRANRKANKKPNIPVYDIEGYRKHKDAFKPGEPVWVTEKLHGCNARFVHTGKRFFVGSRTMFRTDKGNVWALAAERYGLEAKLKKFPGVVLFGEVYGEVQDLKYGVPANERVRFAAFDAMFANTRQYMDPATFRGWCKQLDIPVVPTLHEGPWDPSLLALADGPSAMPGATHIREGIVIKPMTEQHVHGLGRKFLKMVGEGYLLRKEAA